MVICTHLTGGNFVLLVEPEKRFLSRIWAYFSKVEYDRPSISRNVSFDPFHQLNQFYEYYL